MAPRARWLPLVLVASIACSRSLELPAPPAAPGPGTVQGAVAFAVPGQAEPKPAIGAIVSLERSSQVVTAQGDGARFVLGGITEADGFLLVRFDENGDGQADRQKRLSLQGLAKPGRDVELGVLMLGKNATVSGQVLRGDLGSAKSGHGGTTVFVPEGPALTLTADDGSFTLGALPEGPVAVSFFRAGYRSDVRALELRAGELATLGAVQLVADPTTAQPATVKGTVGFERPEVPAAGTTVTLTGDGAPLTATADANGAYRFTQVPPGLYTARFERADARAVVLRNLLVQSPETSLPDVVLAAGLGTTPELDGGAAGGGSGAGGGNVAGGGSAAGGGAAAGGGSVGGPDGGPVARIFVLPSAQVSPGLMFQLDGLSSSGTPPLTFHWSQDAGTPVTIMPNGTPLSGTPMVIAPTMPQVLRLGLTVVDGEGRASAPTTAQVVVSRPPQGTVVPQSTSVTVGTVVQLDASGSTAPSGSGLVAYQWRQVTGPPAMLTPLSGADRARCNVLLPNGSTPGEVRIELVVRDNFGLQSEPVEASIVYSAGSGQGWLVDAGAPQFVDGGIVVTLRGEGIAPGVPGAGFNYQWKQTNGPAVSLSSTTASTTTFISPFAQGPNLTLGFSLEATSVSGLMPPMLTGNTTVTVEDKVAPEVANTSIFSGQASRFGVHVEFSEPVSATSLASVQVIDGALAPSFFDRVQTGPTGWDFIFTPPLTIGATYTLSLSGVADLAVPYPNTMPNRSYPFTANQYWQALWQSTSSSNAEPVPGVAVLPPTGGRAPSGYELSFVARKEGTQPWVFAPQNPFVNCPAGSPCPLSDAPASGFPTLSGIPARGRRGLEWNGRALAQFETKGFPTPATSVLGNRARTASQWTPFAPSPPGHVFTHGGQLHSVWVDSGGLQYARFDGATFGANVATLSTDPAYATSGTPLAIGGGSKNGSLAVVVKESSGATLHFFRRTPTMVWSQVDGTPVTALLDARPALDATGNFYVVALRKNGAVNDLTYESVTSGGTSPIQTFVTGNVTSYDVLVKSSVTYVAYALDGDLFLIGRGPGGMINLPGPTVGSTPANVLDFDPSCEAKHPELAEVQEGLVITWQERCAAGPWRVYARFLR